MNAPAPMTGGMICPPELATASTAPAKYAGYPIFFIRGIVKLPVPYTFATAEPDMDPNRHELTTAIFAGPPAVVPVKACATSMKNIPAPLFSRKPPKIRKTITYAADTPSGMEKIPSSVRYTCSMTSGNEKDNPRSRPGM